jgi:hypothetical protein
MGTLLKASEADWALAKRRERVLSTLAESKECSRAMMQKACAALQLSRAMVFRLLGPDTGKTAGLALCFCIHADESVEVEGSEKSRSGSLLRIRKIGGKSGRLRALHRKIAAACRKRRLPIPSYGTVLRRSQAYAWRTS